MGRDLVILSPTERRDTLLHVIRRARHRLTFSLFRCDDRKVLNGRLRLESALADLSEHCFEIFILLATGTKLPERQIIEHEPLLPGIRSQCGLQLSKRLFPQVLCRLQVVHQVLSPFGDCIQVGHLTCQFDALIGQTRQGGLEVCPMDTVHG